MSQTDTPRFNIHSGNELTWNVKPILHEIRHALLELLDNGNTSVIDLRSIPLAPGEEETIISALGQGEVHARLDALGRSDIVETTYSGVWLVTHYNENEAVAETRDNCSVWERLENAPHNHRDSDRPSPSDA